jgi:hypothetical protein
MAATGLLGINPYRKGVAVDFSSKPTSLYIDMQQKERARQEALDKYFMDYDKNINPAGMRSIDIDGLTQKQLEGKSFYYQNRKAIQNPMLDGGKAYTQFNKYHQEQLSGVAKSKKAAADELVLQKATLDSKKNGYVIDDETFQGTIKSSKSIWDKEYQPFDLKNFNAYKPFDPLAFGEEIFGKDGERFTSKFAEQVVSGKSFKNFIVTTVEPSQLGNIEAAAKGRLINGMRTKDGFARIVMAISENPYESAEINKVFRKYYDRDIKSPYDIAVGLALQQAPYKREEKIGALTPETRITIANQTGRTGGGGNTLEDGDMDARISQIRSQSQDPNPQILSIVKGIMPTQGLKDVTGSLAEYKQGNFPDADYMYQDEANNLYVFGINKQNQITDANYNKGSYTFVPYSALKLSLTKMFSNNPRVNKEAKTTTKEAPSTTAAQPTTGSKIKFIVNGKVYNIPQEEANEFLNQYPNAKKG